MHHSIMIYQFYLLMLLCYVVYVNDHWGCSNRCWEKLCFNPWTWWL